MGWSEFKDPDEKEKPTKSVFYDADFGFNRILTFLRMDFSFRLTHKRDRNFYFTLRNIIALLMSLRQYFNKF